MNKKRIKAISIFLLLIIIFFSINNQVFAFDILQKADEFITGHPSTIDSGKVAEILKPIANILLTIGSVVIVVVAVVIAIKYLTASPDSKGKLKAQLVGLFVSAVVLYGSYGIWAISYTVLNDLFK